MTVKRKGDELIIKIPSNVDLAGLQRLIDYINYNSLTLKSKADQSSVDQLSSSINKDWWSKNKDRLLND